MSYVILLHVATGDVATAALHNQLLDDIAILATSINTADGSILAPAAIIGSVSSNKFGGALGSSASPVRSTTNILLYDSGASNWAGIGSDTGGKFYIVTGTSGTPSTRFSIDPAGAVAISGTLSVASSMQVVGVLQVGSVGGLSASFPAWRNTGAQMEAVLGNQTNYADVRGSRFFSMSAGSVLVDLTVSGFAAIGTRFSIVSAGGGITAAAGQLVLANGTFNVTLPAVTAGVVVDVKNVGTGVITVLPASGTIDGAGSFVLQLQYQSITLVADGTNWWIR